MEEQINDSEKFWDKRNDACSSPKELNRISWFGKEDKLDIRGWSEDHSKMTKGISLTEDEFIKIARAGLEKTGGI